MTRQLDDSGPSRRTDNGAAPPAECAYRLPNEGPLPDLPLYERLIDDGIAAADAQGSPVDHLTARRLAIWLAARPQPSVFAQALVGFVNTGAISSALKTQLRIHARSGNYPDRPEAARLMQYCVARGADLGPLGESFGATCDQIDRSEVMLAARHGQARHGCTYPGQARPEPSEPGSPPWPTPTPKPRPSPSYSMPRQRTSPCSPSRRMPTSAKPTSARSSSSASAFPRAPTAAATARPSPPARPE